MVDRIHLTGARCVRLVAGPGWGKSALAHAYAAAVPHAVAYVRFRGITRVEEFDAEIGAALTTLGVPPAGNAMQRWAMPGPRSTIVIDDLDAIDTVDGAVDLLRGLLRRLPPDRNLLLCSRDELPIVWSTYFAPHEIAKLGSHDLALDRNDIAALVASVTSEAGIEDAILGISRGWPIAALLFVRLARNGLIGDAFENLGDATTFGDLHAYIQTEIFDQLDPAERETLCATVLLGGGNIEAISIAVGRDSTADFARLAGPAQSLLLRHGDVYQATPLVFAAAMHTQQELLRELTRAASARFNTAGHFVRAAELALALGDEPRAIRSLDDAGEPIAGFVPDDAYLRVALTISLDNLADSKNVLTILLAGHIPAGVRLELAQNVEDRWRELDGNDRNSHLRTVLLVARAYLLRLSGDFEGARKCAASATQNAARLPDGSPIARALRVIQAALAFAFADIDAANAAWKASGEPLRATDTFFAAERVECEIFAAIASADTYAIARAYEASMDELAHWHHEFGATIAHLTAGGQRFFATGRFPEREAAQLSSRDGIRYDTAALSMISAAIEQTDRDVALTMLNASIQLADGIGLPHLRVLPRIIAAAIEEGPARARNIDEALHNATGELRLRVADLAAGNLTESSIFFPFLQGHATWKKVQPNPICRIEIMRGRILYHGDLIQLRAREYELLVALALAPDGALTREAITRALWPDQTDAVAAGSLRSTLHRLRQQLEGTAFIVRGAKKFRLSSDVTIDVKDAEVVYNALRRAPADMNEIERARLEHHFRSLAYPVPDLYARWPWFEPLQSRLVDLRHGLGILLAREDFRMERYASAVRWTEQLVQFDAIDEVAAELLFQSLIRSQGQSEAARWLRRYRDMLAREYDSEPSFEFDAAPDGPTTGTA